MSDTSLLNRNSNHNRSNRNCCRLLELLLKLIIQSKSWYKCQRPKTYIISGKIIDIAEWEFHIISLNLAELKSNSSKFRKCPYNNNQDKCHNQNQSYVKIIKVISKQIKWHTEQNQSNIIAKIILPIIADLTWKICNYILNKNKHKIQCKI